MVWDILWEQPVYEVCRQALAARPRTREVNIPDEAPRHMAEGKRPIPLAYQSERYQHVEHGVSAPLATGLKVLNFSETKQWACTPSSGADPVIAGVGVCGVGRYEVADPPEQPARADPQPRRDDKPQDAGEDAPVIELPDPGDDQTENRCQRGITHRCLSSSLVSVCPFYVRSRRKSPHDPGA
jgi:hypothetical protein